MKNKVIMLIIAVLVICALAAVIIPGHDSSQANKTEVRICADNVVDFEYFINETERFDYYRSINDTTLNWLESLNGSYKVFVSGEAYYIMSDYEVNKLPPLEHATDVSIYDICNCTIEESRHFGEGLANVTLISDVDYLYQDIEQYPV